MDQAEIDRSLPFRNCPHCRGMMRLVSSEPHPVAAHVDLQTFDCIFCGFVESWPVPSDTRLPLDRAAALAPAEFDK